jgi:hypothetical protein
MRAGYPVSEQVAQQVDITFGPGACPGGLDHHGASISRPGQPSWARAAR